MPNWKKLIVSGSDANLNSLNITTDLTGSNALITNDLDVRGDIEGVGLIQVENTLDNNIIGKLIIDYASGNNPRLSSVGGTEIDFQTDLVIRNNKGLYSDTSSSTGLIIGSQRADTPIKFLTSPATNSTYSEAMRIAGDGNVGIGVTNLTYKLDVDGNANVTGSVTATSFIGNLNGNVNGNVNGNLVNGSLSNISSLSVTGTGASTFAGDIIVNGGNLDISSTMSSSPRYSPV